ncbi:OmpP1/FadL family transporter [Geomonas azotofigens]|uniref:OmpP1/FadL family transporter n=1 Tax=Geomonas azotofigens TaxID=2843196 RepID=UPI001C1004A9|nr:outer membrane protein transport protein [Geomonas azotofigens]MBU5613833.1 outer membrane protein transport protein [Geomonas azotofigens]
MKCYFLIPALVGTAVVAITGISHASGNKITEQSAKAQAMGNAFAAQADDPSALAYNPAGIAYLKGRQIQIGYGVVLLPQTEFNGVTNISSPNTTSEMANGDLVAVPTVYLTHEVTSIPLSFGLGVNSFFPLVKRWDEGGGLREVASISIKPVNFQPTLAYRFDDLNLAVAAAADITYARFSSECFLYNGALGGNLGMLGLDATAVGYGYTLGLLWKATPALSFGASYRSKIDLKFDGDANFMGLANSASLPPPYNAVVPGSGTTVRSRLSADYTLPDNAILAVAWKPVQKVTLEFDAEHTGWSSYKEFKVDYQSSAPIYAAVLSQPVPKKWHDVWSYHFGGQYSVNDYVDLRSGYTYEENPVPDSTLGSDLPDANRHYFSVGTGVHNAKAAVDFAYTYVLFDDRTISSSANNPQIKNGTFKSDAHLLGISLTCKF